MSKISKKSFIKNSSKAFIKHDHSTCLNKSMLALEKHFHTNKLQLTPLRRKIFEYLLKDHKPLGAYEILNKLRDDGFSSTPPIAYRVLDFLITEGFVHKIKRMNAFVACTNPGNRHSPAFMICRKCKKVAEVQKDETMFDLKKVSSKDFEIEESVIELIGVCKPCNNLEAA